MLILKRFEVTNYKNFKDTITVNFSKVGGYHFNSDCITNNTISKMLIYGRNATGKTNLGRALGDIVYVGLGGKNSQTSPFINADSVFKEAVFNYVFQFGNDEIIYSYRRLTESKIFDERLSVNNNQAFYYNFETGENEFDNLKLLGADTAVTDRFLETIESIGLESDESRTIPFLRWLINNTILPNDSVLLKLYDFIRRMSMLTVGSTYMYRSREYYEAFFEMLDTDDNLDDFEEFLNVMGVECKLEIRKLPDGQKELYFAYSNPVSFLETASSGTRSLMNLYIRLVMRKGISFLYIDEFDAFYHYEMSEKVIKFFKKKYPDSQIIMTTHNTNLMTNSLMRPDCLFILSRQGYLTALCDATPRELREGHNMEKLYISGEFEDYE